MPHARNGVIRIFFAGDYIGGRDVTAPALHTGYSVERNGAGREGADVRALLQELSVFSADSQPRFEIREKSVITLDPAVDPELREEIVSAVVQQATVAYFVGQTARAAVLDGTADRQAL